MPLRVDEGVDIPLERSRGRELRSGFLDDTLAVLPFEVPVGPGEPHNRLGVETVSQRPREFWCWAACAEMVLRFLGAPLDKCTVAGRHLRRNDCCGPSSAVCDTALSVDGIGEAFGGARLVGNLYDALRFETLQKKIDGDPASGTPPHPVVAAIQWVNGGGHLVVISGWRISGALRYVKVNDPWYTSGDIRYEDVLEKYGPNDNGKWVFTWADFRRV